MGIIDSHNHIHFREFNKDRQAVMDRAASAGIRTMLAVGIDPKDCARAVQTARTYPGVYVAVGIHPQNGGKHTREDVFALSSLHADKVVAVGETGFDLYRTPHSAEDQEDLFRAHIELAQHMRLPIVIHDREAHRQTMHVLDDTGAWGLGGVFHCFSGDADLARTVVRKGFLVSIPGVVTFRNASPMRDVVRALPLEHLLVETDAPYLTPEPYRGKRNEPLYTVRTVEEIARIKGVTPDEVARRTTENFSRLFLGGKPAAGNQMKTE